MVYGQYGGINMRIIVGLGNPGSTYIATRHNIGFDTITRISDEYDIPLDFKKHKALCGKGIIKGEKVLLVQPQTFMNLSGECVRELIDYYKITPNDLIIIYDDISLEVGQLRIRPMGSAGGHNGIKNIIANLGTQEFPRIKIGVGEKPKEWELKDYVLGRFLKEEEPIIRETLDRALKACTVLIKEGIDAAMNEFNRKLQNK